MESGTWANLRMNYRGEVVWWDKDAEEEQAMIRERVDGMAAGDRRGLKETPRRGVSIGATSVSPDLRRDLYVAPMETSG